MKKSFSKYFAVSVMAALFFIFSYMLLLTEIQALNKLKLERESFLSQKQSELNSTIVELQKYSSEDRIVRFGKENLNLVKETKKISVIPISKKQILQINKLVKRRYE